MEIESQWIPQQQQNISNTILKTHTLRDSKKAEEEPYCSCLGEVPLDTGI